MQKLRYKFKGNRTTGGIRRAGNPSELIYSREVPKYTQIGNAVPFKLAFEIGKKIKKDFDIKKTPLLISMVNCLLEDKKFLINWNNFK